jgi:soluble lytic murein transglycosylase
MSGFPTGSSKLKNRLWTGSLSLVLGFAIVALLIGCSRPSNFEPAEGLLIPAPSSTPIRTPDPTSTPYPTAAPTPVPSALLQSADNALFIGDWDMAMDLYQELLQVSDSPELTAAARLGIARTYQLSGGDYPAVQELNQLIVDFPDSPEAAEAYYYLAKAYTSQEQHLDAARAYQNYLQLRPGVLDSYVQDWIGDAYFSAGDYLSAAQEYQRAAELDSLLDQDWLELKAARSYALSGEFQAALDLYDRVYARTQNDTTKSLINLRKGQIFTTLGQVEEAFRVYQEAVDQFPTAYDSYTALVALVDAGVPVDELQRGIVDYYAGQYGVALAAFDRYLQDNPADPGTALYYSGLANRASGNYQVAVAQWEKLIQDHPDHEYWDKAWEEMAYTQWAYLDQYSLAIENLLEFVSIAPDHSRAVEFLFDAASVAEIADRLEQAAELWERVAVFYPGYEKASRARFLAGITYYRLGRLEEALVNFQMLTTEGRTIEDRAAAFLWLGKTHQAVGDLSSAESSWQRAVNVDPTGYYSERARDLLLDRDPFYPPMEYDLVVDWENERAIAEEWMRAQFSIPEEVDLSGLGLLANEARLIRGTELWYLGEYSLARNEFESLRKTITSDAELSYRLMNYMFDLGVFRTAIFSARQVLDLAGMDEASTLTAPGYFNHIRFGIYYPDLIIPIAQEYNFHPLFLYSVIRQESLFESFVQSSAAASGLMQIMPGTGADIARNMGWPSEYVHKDLYRPLVNVTFGADYLDTQRNLYSGDLYTALAAYNGGPGNAREWKKLAPLDEDLFLEVIRFPETRLYIRSISEIFNLYRILYDRTP